MPDSDDAFPLLEERSTMLSVSLTCALLFMWLFLCILFGKHLWYVCKHNELQRRLKFFASCCTISFFAYISLSIASMVFYQRGLIVKYRYAVAVLYVLNATGKQSMYCVFLTTLYTTFKRSQFEMSKKVFKFVVVLIVINGVLGLAQSIVWIDNRILRSSNSLLGLQWCHYLTLCMTPTELFYSLFIITLFARRLFRIALQRVNERKSAQYERRVRVRTASMMQRHKVALEEFGRIRAQSHFSEPSGDAGEDAAVDLHHKFTFGDDSGDMTAVAATGNSTADLPCNVPTVSPSSVSTSQKALFGKAIKMPDTTIVLSRSRSVPMPASAPTTPLASLKSTVMRGFPSTQFDSSIARSSSPRSQLQMKRTPSLRQRKSMNIRRFNKENRALLDHYQVKMMKTAARYTVLSSVAFITTLCCTCFVAVAWLWSMRTIGTGWQLQLQKVDFTVTLLFMSTASNYINVLAVILNFAIFPKFYRYLCCCSFCCKGCFMYCALRQMMNKVEDQMTMEFQSECDLQLQQMELELGIELPPMSDMASCSSKDGGTGDDLDGVDADDDDEEIVIENIDIHGHFATHASAYTNTSVYSPHTVESAVSPSSNTKNTNTSHSLQMSEFVILDPSLQPGESAAAAAALDQVPKNAEEKETETETDNRPVVQKERLSMMARISKKIMSITITSPDNKNTVLMAARKRASQLGRKKKSAAVFPGSLHAVQSLSSSHESEEKREVVAVDAGKSSQYDQHAESNSNNVHGQQTSAVSMFDISAVLDKEESLSKGLDDDDQQGHARFESVDL